MPKAKLKSKTKITKKVVKNKVKPGTKSKSTQKPKVKTSSKKPIKKTKAKKVSAVPEGYQAITPYLIVNNAKAAIEFYKKAFGAKEMAKLEKPDGKIGHAELKFGQAIIMLSDECPEMAAHAPQAYKGSPVSIHLYIKNVDEVLDRSVKAGAKITRPAENMFYGDRNALVEDPFGHKWCISTHVENVTPREIKKRALAFFSEK